MQVREIMTPDPACCRPETSLSEVAKMMVEQDCGAIPVVDASSDHAMRLIGMVTDRDIAIRAVAAGKLPDQTFVREVMSHPIASVLDTSTCDECLATMEQNQIRRAPIVDLKGNLVGIVAQADIARRQGNAEVCELLQEVSKGFGPGHG